MGRLHLAGAAGGNRGQKVLEVRIAAVAEVAGAVAVEGKVYLRVLELVQIHCAVSPGILAAEA